jgi:hypothetical protein
VQQRTDTSDSRQPQGDAVALLLMSARQHPRQPYRVRTGHQLPEHVSPYQLSFRFPLSLRLWHLRIPNSCLVQVQCAFHSTILWNQVMGKGESTNANVREFDTRKLVRLSSPGLLEITWTGQAILLCMGSRRTGCGLRTMDCKRGYVLHVIASAAHHGACTAVV